jgi:S-adenosylmethionine:tRNA ribosyltransferase-isomerase
MVRSQVPDFPAAPFRFDLPDDLAAPAPPEKRGLARDGVRLLAVDRGTGVLTHTRFPHIGGLLRPGDCLVFNASRTLPAALPARFAASGQDTMDALAGTGSAAAPGLQLRLARRWENGDWSVLILAGDQPWRGDLEGARLDLPGRHPGTGMGAVAAAVAPAPYGLAGKAVPGLAATVLERDPHVDRLWKIRFSRQGQELMEALSRLGHPVRYWYADAPWDLDYYQTVYAREPGSVEMPSAGRAFTWELMQKLRRQGIGMAYLVLHAGLSSYMDEAFDALHPASVEPFRLEAPAAAAINAAKARGGRILAVGTTVVRALESIADACGRVRAETGSTRLRITPGYTLKTVDGLLTGFHEPAASHLDLLTAFLPADKLLAVYRSALSERYLWHEFGDMNLIA